MPDTYTIELIPAENAPGDDNGKLSYPNSAELDTNLAEPGTYRKRLIVDYEAQFTVAAEVLISVIEILSIGPQDPSTGDIPVLYTIDRNDSLVQQVVYPAALPAPTAGDFAGAGDPAYISMGTVALTQTGVDVAVTAPAGLQGSYRVAYLPSNGGDNDVAVSDNFSIDTVLPTVTSLSPENNEQGVDINATLGMTFDSSMREQGVLSIRDANGGLIEDIDLTNPALWTAPDTLLVTPSAPFVADVNTIIRWSGLADERNNLLPDNTGNELWRFKAGAVSTAPVVVTDIVNVPEGTASAQVHVYDTDICGLGYKVGDLMLISVGVTRQALTGFLTTAANPLQLLVDAGGSGGRRQSLLGYRIQQSDIDFCIANGYTPLSLTHTAAVTTSVVTLMNAFGRTVATQPLAKNDGTGTDGSAVPLTVTTFTDNSVVLTVNLGDNASVGAGVTLPFEDSQELFFNRGTPVAGGNGPRGVCVSMYNKAVAGQVLQTATPAAAGNHAAITITLEA